MLVQTIDPKLSITKSMEFIVFFGSRSFSLSASVFLNSCKVNVSCNTGVINLNLGKGKVQGRRTYEESARTEDWGRKAENTSCARSPLDNWWTGGEIVIIFVGVSIRSVRSKTGPNRIDREPKFRFFSDRTGPKFYNGPNRTEPK